MNVGIRLYRILELLYYKNVLWLGYYEFKKGKFGLQKIDGVEVVIFGLGFFVRFFLFLLKFKILCQMKFNYDSKMVFGQ